MASSVKETGSEFEKGERVRHLHVAPYFWVRKTPEECSKILVESGYPYNLDPHLAPEDVQQKFLRIVVPDEQEMITFEPGELVLAQTEEEVEIPGNESWEIETYFIDGEGAEIPLTTNCTAPNLHPYSSGPQTYEIINESENPITIDYRNLVCKTKIHKLTGHAMKPSSTFSRQKKGEMRLTSPYDEEIRTYLIGQFLAD